MARRAPRPKPPTVTPTPPRAGTTTPTPPRPPRAGTTPKPPGVKPKPVVTSGRLAAAGAVTLLGLYALGDSETEQAIKECVETCPPDSLEPFQVNSEAPEGAIICQEENHNEYEGGCDQWCVDECVKEHDEDLLGKIIEGADQATGDTGVVGDALDTVRDVAGDVTDEALDLSSDLMNDLYEASGLDAWFNWIVYGVIGFIVLFLIFQFF